ncbi:zinc knuckle, partial [Opisthorchis viverrini]
MESEEVDGIGYDSDSIDEEIEHSMYSAVFFESVPKIGAELDDMFFTGCSKEAATMNKDSGESETSVKTSSVDSSRDQFLPLNISQFKDDSDSDGYGSHFQTDLHSATTEESDSESAITMESFDSHVSTTLSGASADVNWTPDDVVLGVSRQAVSSVCNPGDPLDIARKLASSRSDPDLWRINAEDRRSSSRTGSHDKRYFNDFHNAVCANCRKRGHFTFECRISDVVCIFCGIEGHMKENCKNMYCFACLAPGHTKKSCTLLSRLKQSVCERCGLQGHQSHLCTELWRQYKNTTSVGKPVPIPVKMLSHRGCCNCGRRGHTIEQCRCRPFRSNFIGPSPRRRVLVYDKKNIFKKKALRAKGKSEVPCGEIRVADKRQKRKKRRKLGPHQVDDPTTNMESLHEKSSLNTLEMKVNERLFDMVMDREVSKAKETVPSDQKDRTPTFQSSLDRIKSRRQSVDIEATFLPLSSRGKKRPKNARQGGHAGFSNQLRKSKSAPSFSPFVWINEHTASGRINEDRCSPVCSPHTESPLFDFERKKGKDFSRTQNSASKSSDIRRGSFSKSNWNDEMRNSTATLMQTHHADCENTSTVPRKRKKMDLPTRRLHMENASFCNKNNRKNKELRTFSDKFNTVNSASQSFSKSGPSKCFTFLNRPPEIELWETSTPKANKKQGDSTRSSEVFSKQKRKRKRDRVQSVSQALDSLLSR